MTMMMEENVIPEGGSGGATARHQAQPQQRYNNNNNNSSGGTHANRTSRSSRSSVSARIASLVKKALWIVTILVRILLYPLRRVVQVVFPAKEFDGLASADKAARAFCTRHFPDGPFEARGYSTITNNSNKMLLVYLHSPLHASSFVRTVMASPAMTNFLNSSDHLSCFAASIHTADGAHVANSLHATSFPFIALLAPNLQVQLKLEGPRLLSCTNLITYLQLTLQAHVDHQSEQQETLRQQREQQRLRQEQDDEYRHALEEDERRERARLDQIQRVEDEAQAVATRTRQERERTENRYNAAKEKMGVEPTMDEANVTRLRLMLPSGQRLERRFRGTDVLAVVRAFLIVYFQDYDIPITNFALVCNYPKRSFQGNDDDDDDEEEERLTLQEVGFYPMCVLMIQDLDA